MGLQKGRRAQQTLDCIKDFESELRQVSGEQGRRVTHHHHDDDKSFRGVVERHARDSGWLDTHTEIPLPPKWRFLPASRL